MSAGNGFMTGSRTVSIIGTGMYVPEKVLTNHDLEMLVETNDEWIFSRTGMRERHIAAPGQPTSDLAARAAEAALADAGIGADEVDLLIVATMTPDLPMPSTACLVQTRIGAQKAYCFDLSAACSGFLYALETAKNQIASGAVHTALVIGAETMSSVLDWEDRTTCVLFGDGAGAAVLRPAGAEIGISHAILGSDGSLSKLLNIPAGGSRMPASAKTVADRMHYLKMGGREVFKHAVTNMTRAAEQVLAEYGKHSDDIALVIPHQANVRIINAIAQRLDCADKVFSNVHKYANTSAATLPIAYHEACKSGRLQRGDLAVLVAFGGGFTWGANLIEVQ